jgi:CRISPR-associated protein Csx14
MTTFLATLGQRPEAITVALDVLRQRYQYGTVVILHTEPRASRIVEALGELQSVLETGYEDTVIHYREVKGVAGQPVLDITSSHTAEDYFRGVYAILHDYMLMGDSLHLLVAGGRKAMSIYALLAAALVFRGQDRVWTVLTPEHLLKPGRFHIPAGWQHEIQVVTLPLFTARLTPGGRDSDPFALVNRRQDQRADFLARLTKQERVLADLFTEHPYATDVELGGMLDKSPRTVENQLGSIYKKLAVFFDDSEKIGDKRRLLADLLLGRLD